MGGTTTDAVLIRGLLKGCNDSRMIRQAEIVITAKTQTAFTVDLYLDTLGTLQGFALAIATLALSRIKRLL